MARNDGDDINLGIRWTSAQVISSKRQLEKVPPYNTVMHMNYDARSGHWIGFYYCVGQRHAFEVDLIFSTKFVTGNGDDAIGQFSINGKWDAFNDEIAFCKQYIGAHSVDYKGTLSPDGRNIKGNYIVGTAADAFTMTLSS